MKTVSTHHTSESGRLQRKTDFLRSYSSTAKRQWLEEQRKAEDARDWPRLMAFLGECESLAGKAGIRLLEASAFGAQESIRIVHFKEPEKGDRLGWERIDSFSKGEVEDFLISGGIAIWLTDTNRWDLALPWFNRAAECAFDGLDGLRMQNQLRRAEALYRAGQDAGAAFQNALLIAEQSDELEELDIVLCLVERAMWQWLKGDQRGCLYTWDRALELMLVHDRTTTRWKNLFVLMGNHTSVFSGVDTGTQNDVPGRPRISRRCIVHKLSDGSVYFAHVKRAVGSVHSDFLLAGLLKDGNNPLRSLGPTFWECLRLPS